MSDGEEKVPKEVKDHSGRYNLAMVPLAFVTLGSTFAASLTAGGVANWCRGVGAFFGFVTAVVVYFKWRNESRYKKTLEDARVSLQEALGLERVETSLLINGAMLGTADKLREFAALDQGAKYSKVDGLRQSVVGKVCYLVKSDRPRAAYYRVEDIFADKRTMTLACSESKSRTDQFTSVFTEGDTKDSNVWGLIDHGDVESTPDIDVRVVEGFDKSRHREYKSYVSVAVRAGDIAFGMLTANMLEAGGFNKGDIDIVRVLARLLAAAEVATLPPATRAKAQVQSKIRGLASET
ncbi:hypothetical protein [Mycobacteroides abscessus]|uniref:hypothetical protein n=1 Tax=Mycobacteroides abscessus TaxID=36809 RepID=UPI001F416A22|nr:hypothetical protein [Mycobacteroides abscessus]